LFSKKESVKTNKQIDRLAKETDLIVGHVGEKSIPKRKGFVRNELSVSKKSGVDYQHRSSADIQYIRNGSKYMQCDKCKQFLGIWHAVRSASFKKRNKPYIIKCKSCGHGNVRIKGALREELDAQWVD
jgi:RNase P subunit RPR2